jgi:HK97 gp10 family phage protein
MMATTVRIRGQEDLYHKLSTVIPYRIEAKALQQALGAGAAVIVRQAKANIGKGDPYPESRTGTMKRAVYQSRGRKTTPQMAVRIVSVRKGRRAQKSNRDAYYARMVEFGHKARTGANSSGAPRWIEGRPFMEPARESTDKQAQDAVLRRLQKLIEKAAAGKLR